MLTKILVIIILWFRLNKTARQPVTIEPQFVPF